MPPLLSVIVPVYNSEVYIKECLTSILNQSIADLEILIIDDGSTDHSFEICKEFGKSDTRVNIISQKNSGPSVARNVGLDSANGKYIGFVDSDDWLDQDMYEQLYLNLVKYDADIAMCGYYTIYGVDDIRLRHCSDRIVVMNPAEMLSEYIDWNLIGAAVWSKIYKRELFRNLRFPKNIMGREDAFVMPRLLGAAKRGVHIGTPKYHYRIRPEGLYRREFNESKLTWPAVEKELIIYLKDTYPELVDKAMHLHAYTIIDLLKDIHRSSLNKRYGTIYNSLLDELKKDIDLLRVEGVDQKKLEDIMVWMEKLQTF